MKKLSILLLSIFTIVAFTSCDSAEMGPVANTTEPGSPELTSPESGQSYTMSQDQADDTLMTIEWTEPDFGFTSAPTYSVEMAAEGSNFESPIELASVQATSYPVIASNLNNILLTEDFAANNSHSMQIRVTASISDSVSKAVSEPVTVAVTPYLVEISYPKVYVPGGYQGASNQGTNWTPGDAPALYSVESDDTYEGYVYMANADNQYKFTPDPTWDNGDWGDTGADGTLDSGGDNIVASDAGYYKMNVNLNDMTYTVTNTSWGLIGSATADGWNSDQDMTYNPDTQVWTITTDLTAGSDANAIKFRANDAWNIEYGDTGGDGRLNAGGDNIIVEEAGNYTITLDLSEAPYTYELQQN